MPAPSGSPASGRREPSAPSRTVNEAGGRSAPSPEHAASSGNRPIRATRRVPPGAGLASDSSPSPSARALLEWPSSPRQIRSPSPLPTRPDTSLGTKLPAKRPKAMRESADPPAHPGSLRVHAGNLEAMRRTRPLGSAPTCPDADMPWKKAPWASSEAQHAIPASRQSGPGSPRRCRKGKGLPRRHACPIREKPCTRGAAATHMEHATCLPFARVQSRGGNGVLPCARHQTRKAHAEPADLQRVCLRNTLGWPARAAEFAFPAARPSGTQETGLRTDARSARLMVRPKRLDGRSQICGHASRKSGRGRMSGSPPEERGARSAPCRSGSQAALSPSAPGCGRGRSTSRNARIRPRKGADTGASRPQEHRKRDIKA